MREEIKFYRFNIINLIDPFHFKRSSLCHTFHLCRKFMARGQYYYEMRIFALTPLICFHAYCRLFVCCWYCCIFVLFLIQFFFPKYVCVCVCALNEINMKCFQAERCKGKLYATRLPFFCRFVLYILLLLVLLLFICFLFSARTHTHKSNGRTTILIANGKLPIVDLQLIFYFKQNINKMH